MSVWGRTSILTAAAALVLVTGCGMPADKLVDQQAPDFTLQTLDGKEVRLSQYQGKPVMLTFWGGG